MRVQQHLRLVEQARPALAGLAADALGEIGVAPRRLERRDGVESERPLELRAPTCRLERRKRQPIGEVPVERLDQGLGFLAGKGERGGRHHDEAIAHQAQVHRIGAPPAVRARLPAVRGQGKRSGRKRLFLERESMLQPRLERLRLAARAAAAREQELQRRRARAARLGEQARHDQFAVHGLASFTVRTPFLARCRDRIR